MRLIDKIKIQVSIIKSFPKRFFLNGFANGCKLIFLNSMLIWIDDDYKRKGLYYPNIRSKKGHIKCKCLNMKS